MTRERDHPIIAHPEQYRIVAYMFNKPPDGGEPYAELHLEKDGQVTRLCFLNVVEFSQKGGCSFSAGLSIREQLPEGEEESGKVTVTVRDGASYMHLVAEDVVERALYDIHEMTSELLCKIEAFHAGEISEEALKAYALVKRRQWADADDDLLPPKTEADRIYWAAIRDILVLGCEPRAYHPTADDLKMHCRCLRCNRVARVKRPIRIPRRKT